MSTMPPDRGRWNQPPADPTPPSGSAGRRSRLVWIGAAIVLTVVALVVFTYHPGREQTSIGYSAFLDRVAAGKVATVEINQSSGEITGSYVGGGDFLTQGVPGGMPTSDIRLLESHDVQRSYASPSSSSSVWGPVLTLVIGGVLIGGLVLLMMRRTQSPTTGMASWSRSGARVHAGTQSTTSFADVAGYESVKQELGEVVDFLKNPEHYNAAGARIPKGLLLVGPPGTGKTLLARAVAGEAGVPFITIAGSEFMEMFVGIGAARVRDLFATARAENPSIVFIDEIDAIGRKRGTGLGGGHDEREQTLNQLLAEMDGFDTSEGIVMMAATNRPDILDPALLRAGRFDRQVVVPLPTMSERTAILGVHCRDKALDPDANLGVLARGTPGMSGADLGNLVNEAALIAVRQGRTSLCQADLEAARDRALLGVARSALVLTPEEKRVVACHEAGHAVLAELLPHSDPVHKVSILPTGMALGSTQQLPEQERQLQQRPFLEDAIAVRMGGRAAEELIFGVPSTGAQDDLAAATELANRMVREWGMSDTIGPMAWGPRGPVFLGEELVHTRDYSDETARVIDQEVARILAEQKARAALVLEQHLPHLQAVSRALETRETLSGTEVRRILRAADRESGRSPPDRSEGLEVGEPRVEVLSED